MNSYDYIVLQNIHKTMTELFSTDNVNTGRQLELDI